MNPDARARARELGFEDASEAISYYYGNSDWTDTPGPMPRDPEPAATLPKATQPTLESHVTVSDTTEGRRLVANPFFHQVDTTGRQLPDISNQDELNDDEVRMLKLVHGEADYKSQSVQLPPVPLLLENQEAGGYTVQLAPTIRMPAFAFNVAHPDEPTRAVFADPAFRRAMSIAIDRDQLNEVAFLGQGEPMQSVGFSPLPEWVPGGLTRLHAEHDPEGATAALDGLSLADADGDGFRELPDGSDLVLNMEFSEQGVAGEVVELVAQDWADVGIETAVEEVTPDEYRAAQSADELDVSIWIRGTPVPILLGTSEEFVPPLGSYFDHRQGMLWAEWVESDGASRVEPPNWVKTMIEDVAAFQQTASDDPERAEIGERLARAMAENTFLIGTVLAPAPIYHREALANVPEFQTWSYEYYRTYPYRPTRWFLSDAG